MKRLSYLLAAALITAVNGAGYVAYQRLATAQPEPVTAPSKSPRAVERIVIVEPIDANAGDLPRVTPPRDPPIRRRRAAAAKPVPAPAVDPLTVIEENPYKRRN